MSILSESKGPKVCVLAYPGLCTFEFGICAEIFGLARPEFGANWYRYQVVATSCEQISAAGGLSIQVSTGLDALEDAALIIIPGWSKAGDPVPEALILALQQAHRRGARVASICSGVFVLATAGLLDGRTATTHWRYSGQLKNAYPAINVIDDVLYTDEGDILTSAGSAAGIDLCLHIVRKDFGAGIANEVARRLVLPAHREGGQAQFIPAPVSRHSTTSITRLLDAIRGSLTETWDIKRMADVACTSPRTLLRRFKQATGMSPKDWLLHARIARARELLEASDEPIDHIAEQSGFGSPETFRHHFRRLLGTPPSRYRSAFHLNPREQL